MNNFAEAYLKVQNFGVVYTIMTGLFANMHIWSALSVTLIFHNFLYKILLQINKYSRSNKPSTRVSKTANRVIHKITTAEKDEKNANNGKKDEKTENGLTKPRRNKVSN